MSVRAAKTQEERLMPYAMDMSVVATDTTHISRAQFWWFDITGTHLDDFLLSDCGMTVIKNGNPLATGWLYLSNSKLAQMGWIIADPDLGPKQKLVAVVKLVDKLTHVAESAGYKAIQMLSDQKGLNKILEGSGFHTMEGHTFYMKDLNGNSNGKTQ